ncbi:MAG: hypothetical protein II885_16005 [Oscillospiraceae bacterium]|nr:hypothetical protein [Oscillospiraceae bacterium]
MLERSQRVAECRSSGLSVTHWCVEHDINPKTYFNWQKQKGCNFSANKAEEVYFAAADLIAVFSTDDYTKLLIRQAVAMLDVVSETVETLRIKMDQIASQLPEYPVLVEMDGVGPTLEL